MLKKKHLFLITSIILLISASFGCVLIASHTATNIAIGAVGHTFVSWSDNTDTYQIVIVKWLFWFCCFIILMLFIINLLYVKHRREKKKGDLEKMVHLRTAAIVDEKEKTDKLLAKLLPQEKVEELKNTGKATSQKFEMVTVLFSDIQGFTKIAEEMNPERLIDELDNFFLHFDSVVEKYNIEKIKTIGDAYMCAGGIPDRNRTNPVEVVMAGLEMQDYMRKLKGKNAHIWDLRIGVHTGGVIAGIVGNKRMSYDIWGDTVNTASRMESSGEPGKVNISEHTFDLIKDFFICEHRGKMPVKYKGEINMYFVRGIHANLSEGDGITPNKQFFINLQLLRIYDLEYYIIQKLRTELPDGMYFHNAALTEEIFIQSELISRAEKFSSEEMLYVRTAALFLNVGYVNSYDNTLNDCLVLSSKLLPKFKYTEEQTTLIENIIKQYFNPGETPEKYAAVLLDATHAYLGREDFIQQSLNNFNECKLRKKNLTIDDWFFEQTRILQQTTIYTQSAVVLREISAEDQIKKVKEFMKNR